MFGGSGVLRRDSFLVVFVAVFLVLWGLQGGVFGADFESSWPSGIERTWVGPEYWANRLQDWRINDGRLECLEGRAGKPLRTVHLVTRQLNDNRGEFEMSVRTGLIGGEASGEAAVGFLLGAGPGLDYRAAALVHHSVGKGAGLLVGLDGDGYLFIRDLETPGEGDLVRSRMGISSLDEVELRLAAKRSNGNLELIFVAATAEGDCQFGSVKLEGVDPDRLVGNIALVSSPGNRGECFWFEDWMVKGSKIKAYDDHACGPIISAQHTLSRGGLKMTAQLMPIGMADNQTVELYIAREGVWKVAAKADIVVPGWTATFRVGDWNSAVTRRYRLVYKMKVSEDEVEECTWSGTIRRDPENVREIVVAGFTGNHNIRHPGADRGKYTWTKDWLWFPHNDIVDYVSKHKPDVLFFSGDQVYEGASPTVPDKSGGPSSYLDYMYKWYLWCWAYAELARDIPCICIPDDHDVYQGNLWGAGGRKTDKDDKGGYVMPAEFVKMVERTQCSNLPDPYDPTPLEQGIGVYYTSMKYGRIDFAVLEDRKFKSGPNGLVPPTTSGRADHVIDPDFDPATADVTGAKLLGDRQVKFLKDWSLDWSGVDMKMALSQTMFGNMATHHGPGLSYLVADYDSNGWPQTGRNKALDIFRRCFAFHLGGDQHLSSIVHHGIDGWGDAGWSFVVPSVANFYPRAWLPSEAGKNREEGAPEFTGDHLDGFDNHVTVYAATNPGKSMGHEPASLHDKMPGYGIVRLDKKKRTITMECWPRFADPRKSSSSQYEGWPRTITQEDNYGREAAGYLPTIKVSGMSDPVIQVVNERNGDIVYTIRISGKSWRPKVFLAGTYRIEVGEPGTDQMEILSGVKSGSLDDEREIKVRL